ncbi:MAG: hypothetical protein COX62_03840 [Deltaproteobacteria bacterium CG_4_10_14_0_2_um_filter_43_8]|nr:MAG: hypothetical protein COX62_03840 [Deltaproteobacteria bacterium CG_4_10_14_0_2_um_filter_43_8]PJC64308.1 MAG: hypothetical protein CO021_04710 [Deltaproteobacteria bacterium CG_4_9_14_0_2_um_filter_42_21]
MTYLSQQYGYGAPSFDQAFLNLARDAAGFENVQDRAFSLGGGETLWGGARSYFGNSAGFHGSAFLRGLIGDVNQNAIANTIKNAGRFTNDVRNVLGNFRLAGIKILKPEPSAQTPANTATPASYGGGGYDAGSESPSRFEKVGGGKAAGLSDRVVADAKKQLTAKGYTGKDLTDLLQALKLKSADLDANLKKLTDAVPDKRNNPTWAHDFASFVAEKMEGKSADEAKGIAHDAASVENVADEFITINNPEDVKGKNNAKKATIKEASPNSGFKQGDVLYSHDGGKKYSKDEEGKYPVLLKRDKASGKFIFAKNAKLPDNSKSVADIFATVRAATKAAVADKKKAAPAPTPAPPTAAAPSPPPAEPLSP